MTAPRDPIEAPRFALQATGEPPCDLLGPHEHNGVSSTGPCWRNPMYAGER